MGMKCNLTFKVKGQSQMHFNNFIMQTIGHKKNDIINHELELQRER